MGQSVLIAVIKREIDRMLSRRIYFVACIVLPLFSLFFMGTIFGDGQMENLPIGVVDGDNTVTSRQIIRMVKVDPTFRVTQYYANETEARTDVQKKNIYGYIISGTLIFSTIMNNVIKVIIRRERPIYMIVRETTFSFPSGHTMASVSMYGILIYLINKSNMNKKLKIILSIILGMIPLMVATSRIYLGAHYFSDILGAIMLATIVLLISTKYIKDKKII